MTDDDRVTAIHEAIGDATLAPSVLFSRLTSHYPADLEAYERQDEREAFSRVLQSMLDARRLGVRMISAGGVELPEIFRQGRLL